MKMKLALLAFAVMMTSAAFADDLAPPMKMPTEGAAPKQCGGPASLLCDEPMFCKFPDGRCGESEGFGECAERPQLCTKIYLPVCGCDRKTYSNACVAHTAGQSVAHDGACK